MMVEWSTLSSLATFHVVLKGSASMINCQLLMANQTLKSLLQHHSSKASILRRSAFFTVQLSHPYMTAFQASTIHLLLLALVSQSLYPISHGRGYLSLKSGYLADLRPQIPKGFKKNYESVVYLTLSCHIIHCSIYHAEAELDVCLLVVISQLLFHLFWNNFRFIKKLYITRVW